MFTWQHCSPIGLDMGPCSLKAAQLRRTSAGWELKDLLLLEFSSNHDGKENADPEEIALQLKTLIKDSSLSGRAVVSAMPSAQLDIIPIKISWEEKDDFEEALIKEARAYLSYDIEDAVIDYLPLKEKSSDQDTNRACKTLLISAKREDVEAHLALLKRVKLKPVAIDIRASALARLFRYVHGKGNTNRLVVNMDNACTSLTIMGSQEILLDRNIPWGRDSLVNCLTQHLELDKEKSGELLGRIRLTSHQGAGGTNRNAVQGDTNRLEETISEIISPELERFVQEIERVFIYFSSEMRGAVLDEISLTGRCSTIRDLDLFLQERTEVPTQFFDPLNDLGLNQADLPDKPLNGHGPLFGVALGLALRGIQ